MSDPVFDLALWKKICNSNFKKNISDIIFCDSPVSIVAIEYLRSLALKEGPLGHSVPTDCFVFGEGENHYSAACTRFGGVPFRPSKLAWPLDKDGLPYKFIMQVSFRDSKDHVFNLPGELLLIFARAIKFSSYLSAKDCIWGDFCTGDKTDLYFEWHSDSTSSPMMTANDMPTDTLYDTRLHAVRHRSVDYIDFEPNIEKYRVAITNYEIPEIEYCYLALLRALCRFPKMKIGGVPYWNSSWRYERHYNGRFLLGFSTISPAEEIPYPWTNRHEPFSMCEGVFAGVWFNAEPRVNLFLQVDGSIEFHAEFEGESGPNL